MLPEEDANPDLQFILDRSAIERSLYERLRSSAETELRVVQREPHWETDLDLLLAVSQRLEGLPGD
jgi:hypothetical protein